MKGYEDLVKLVKEVQTSGILNVDMQKICEYQDMIGHSSDEQLTELARGDYKEAFYRVYDLSYGITETIRFYYSHSAKIEELKYKVSELQADLEDAKKLSEDRFHTCEKFRDKYDDMLTKNNDMHKENERLTAENLTLKAKLYDMMTA